MKTMQRAEEVVIAGATWKIRRLEKNTEVSAERHPFQVKFTEGFQRTRGKPTRFEINTLLKTQLPVLDSRDPA